MSISKVIRLTKITNGLDRPDSGHTVDLRTLNNVSYANGIETPANSGLYIATFNPTRSWGNWYVDGTLQSGYNNGDPLWLGNYWEYSGSFIGDLTGSITSASFATTASYALNAGSGGSGTAGTSGTSGLNGSSGTSGTTGATGSSGTSGQTGSSGTSGIDGISYFELDINGDIEPGMSGELLFDTDINGDIEPII